MRVFSFNRFKSAVAPVACALGLLCAAGCSQDEGEQCQVDSDCSGSLMCLRALNSERGTCMKPGTKLDAGTPPSPDAATTKKDAGSAGSGEDGGQSDAGPVAGGDAG